MSSTLAYWNERHQQPRLHCGGVVSDSDADTSISDGADPIRVHTGRLQRITVKRRLAKLAEEALAVGRKRTRSTGPEGVEHLVSKIQDERASALASEVSGSLDRKLSGLVLKVQGPAQAEARTIFFKALAARKEALLGADSRARDAAVDELSAFAPRLHGLDLASLRARSTVLDLDSRVSTSDFDPTGMDELRGVVHAHTTEAAPIRDNDGLFQRFMGSCGTTTLQMAICEADPVRAFQLHEAGLHSASVSDIAARFQEKVLKELGSAALGRSAKTHLARLRNGLGRLKAQDKVKPEDARSLVAHAEGRRRLTQRAERALAALRGLTGGFPSDKELGEIRSDPLKGDDGLELAALQKGLNKYLTPVTGTRYKILGGAEGIPDGQCGQHLDAVEQTLRRGYDVPFGTMGPGHYWLMSAVRGPSSQRHFLVSDPWNGKTVWIPEPDLVSSRFIVEPFDQAFLEDAGYIDSFYVPE